LSYLVSNRYSIPLASGKSMKEKSWLEQCPAAITVCNRDGIILDMNAQAARVFEKDGGKALIGKNLMDCHSEASRIKMRSIIASGEPNTYTIEKNGVKKLIYQCAWREDGHVAGLVEFSIEIPFDMPHFIRS
jgi:transcriptional regulator with PAS, ATPase and Fis domain